MNGRPNLLFSNILVQKNCMDRDGEGVTEMPQKWHLSLSDMCTWNIEEYHIFKIKNHNHIQHIIRKQ